MSRIVKTAKACPLCNTEIRKIVGVLATTEYCANPNCFYIGDSGTTKLGKRLSNQTLCDEHT